MRKELEEFKFPLRRKKHDYILKINVKRCLCNGCQAEEEEHHPLTTLVGLLSTTLLVSLISH
jgi:hypothetical protein